MRVTVTVELTERDKHGDETVVSTFTIPGCVFAFNSSSEDTERKQQEEIGATLYPPPRSPGIPASAHLVIAGERWQAASTSNQWTSPFTGWNPGGEVQIRKVSG